MKKIAFLFLLIDNPNFQDIWNYYFLNADPEKYTIYIHPKNVDNHTWKPDKIINNIVHTEWGKIVNAYLQLFKSALQDSDNYFFVTISESCIPIKTFNIFYDDVIKNDISLVKTLRVTRYDYYQRLSDNIRNKYKNNIIKHYARMCLKRDIVERLINTDMTDFISMHVGDEFFLTSIYPFLYKDFPVTFDDWKSVKDKLDKINKKITLYKEKGLSTSDLEKEYGDIAKNPKTFNKLTKKDLKLIKTCQSYFFRKFSKDSDVNKYLL